MARRPVENCTVKLCSGCTGRGHAANVCPTSKDPTSKEEAVMAVATTKKKVRSSSQLSRPKGQVSAKMVRGKGSRLGR